MWWWVLIRPGRDEAPIGPDDATSRRLRSRRAHGDDGTGRRRHPSARDLGPLLVHRGEELRSGDEQIDLRVSHRWSRDTDRYTPSGSSISPALIASVVSSTKAWCSAKPSHSSKRWISSFSTP